MSGVEFGIWDERTREGSKKSMYAPLAHRKYREIDICFTRGFLNLRSNRQAWTTSHSVFEKSLYISLLLVNESAPQTQMIGSR
jgi:hypothetical protein